MAVYVVARVKVTDPAWVEGYIPNVEALVKAHGGRYLVRSNHLDVIEASGEPPTVMAILEFPNREAAGAFYNSPDYRPWLEARQAGADSELILADGL